VKTRVPTSRTRTCCWRLSRSRQDGEASTSFSRQLLVSALSGSVDAEQMVREDLAKIHALGVDLAAINGSGAANQPRGALNTAGIGSVAGGANGAAPTYGNIVDLETAVANANADVETMGYLSTPVMRGKLKQTLNFAAAAAGQPVWGKGEMNGYRAEASTQVPSALVKGTSIDCHAIIFGDWSQLVIGEWGAFELITDPYRLKKQGMIEVTSFQMVDVILRYAEAIAAMKDARNI
jgi:HK97 family phage major capsid protein